MACKSHVQPLRRKAKGPDRSGPLEDVNPWARQLLLLGSLNSRLLALEIGSPAFAFDVLVELLAHGRGKTEGSMFQSEREESSGASSRPTHVEDLPRITLMDANFKG